MAENVPETVQRWTSKRRVALVLSILKGETSAKEAARKHGLKVAEVEDHTRAWVRSTPSAPVTFTRCSWAAFAS